MRSANSGNGHNEKRRDFPRKTEFQFRVSLFILKLPPRHSRIPNLVPTISPSLCPLPASPLPTRVNPLWGKFYTSRIATRDRGGQGMSSRLLGRIPASSFSDESAQSGRSAAALRVGGHRINEYLSYSKGSALGCSIDRTNRGPSCPSSYGYPSCLIFFLE